MRNAFLIVVVGLMLVFTGAPGQAVPNDELTLERLYSLPRLIGTAPTGIVWAPDSSRFAFLWNDEGTNFRDVWMAAPGDEARKRLLGDLERVVPPVQSQLRVRRSVQHR